jgi:hypothetical protein
MKVAHVGRPVFEKTFFDPAIARLPATTETHAPGQCKQITRSATFTLLPYVERQFNPVITQLASMVLYKQFFK